MAPYVPISSRRLKIFRYLQACKFKESHTEHTTVFDKGYKRIVIGYINVWMYDKTEFNELKREDKFSLHDDDYFDAVKHFVEFD